MCCGTVVPWRRAVAPCRGAMLRGACHNNRSIVGRGTDTQDSAAGQHYFFLAGKETTYEGKKYCPDCVCVFCKKPGKLAQGEDPAKSPVHDTCMCACCSFPLQQGKFVTVGTDKVRTASMVGAAPSVFFFLRGHTPRLLSVGGYCHTAISAARTHCRTHRRAVARSPYMHACTLEQARSLAHSCARTHGSGAGVLGARHEQLQPRQLVRTLQPPAQAGPGEPLSQPTDPTRGLCSYGLYSYGLSSHGLSTH